MTLTDYMCQGKKEEEDLPTLKTALTLRKIDYSLKKRYWQHDDQ